MIHALCIDFFQKLVGGGGGDLPAEQYDLELGNYNYQSQKKKWKNEKSESEQKRLLPAAWTTEQDEI